MEQFYNEATKYCEEEEECRSPEEGLGPTENSYDLTEFIFENESHVPDFTFPGNQNNGHSLINGFDIQSESNNVGNLQVYSPVAATNFTQLKLEKIDLASITQTSLAAGSEATLVDVKPNSKINSRRRKMSNPDSTDVPDYRNKRDRNNIAVRKSREKAKEQQKMAKERVDYLRKENKLLESKVAQLQSELKLCRNMFIKSGAQVPEVLEKALKDM
ncbi:unnamed protein product [Acanthosepion pharaonis]|uniref:BZIP domain-containing protein n=1 Tax=Acanthosepion pharaonis TaxID=158019 RepID=A0A812ER00_ACAPH|nr:unnamed protein product [Sepia pharaonis]